MKINLILFFFLNNLIQEFKTNSNSLKRTESKRKVLKQVQSNSIHSSPALDVNTTLSSKANQDANGKSKVNDNSINSTLVYIENIILIQFIN